MIASSTWTNFVSVYSISGPPGDRYERARDAARFARRQEQNDAADLPRRRPQLRVGLWHRLAVHRVVHRRGEDRVHGDPLALHLGRERLGPSRDRALAHRVGGAIPTALERADRGDADDAPVAAGAHRTEAGRRRGDGGTDVRVPHLAHDLEIGRRTIPEAAGEVRQDVEASP